MTDAWEAMADVWLDGTPSRLWRAHSDAVNVRLLEAWLPGDLGTVLKTDLFDEAVASGLAGALVPRATRVTGVDVNERVVEAAARRAPAVSALVADVRALPFEDGAFDTVVSNSTLDHFDEPGEIDAALCELVRVLAPDGRLLVTLDNPRNPVVALGKVLRGHGLNRVWTLAGAHAARVGLAPYHVGATLGRAALVDAVTAAGLEVIRSGTLVHAPRLAAVLAGSVVEQRLGDVSARRFSAWLDACESVGRLPTRSLTAHFVAVVARRPPAARAACDGPARAIRHEREPSPPGSTMAIP